jgi:hypothetical protein
MLGVAAEETPMSDLANWKVHGPVHTLRTEFAEWDLSLEQWKAAQHSNLARFHPDGRISESETHNPDGSIPRSGYAYDAVGRLQEVRFAMNDGAIGKNTYLYDERGRLTRVVSLDQGGIERESEAYNYSQDGKKTKVFFIPKQEPSVEFLYQIESTVQSYGATGATAITTRYEDRGQPDEVLFHDEDHRLLRRVTFTRDSTGRLVREEMHLGEQMPFSDIEKQLENAPPGAREAAVTLFANLFGPQNVMSSTTYAYDGKGRLLERRTRIGELSDHRATFYYDDHDNTIEETAEQISREMQIDGEGNLHPRKDNSSVQNVRFEYLNPA